MVHQISGYVVDQWLNRLLLKTFNWGSLIYSPNKGMAPEAGLSHLSDGNVPTSKLKQAHIDRKSTRLNSSHMSESRMPSSA